MLTTLLKIGPVAATTAYIMQFFSNEEQLRKELAEAKREELLKAIKQGHAEKATKLVDDYFSHHSLYDTVKQGYIDFADFLFGFSEYLGLGLVRSTFTYITLLIILEFVFLVVLLLYRRRKNKMKDLENRILERLNVSRSNIVPCDCAKATRYYRNDMGVMGAIVFLTVMGTATLKGFWDFGRSILAKTSPETATKLHEKAFSFNDIRIPPEAIPAQKQAAIDTIMATPTDQILGVLVITNKNLAFFLPTLIFFVAVFLICLVFALWKIKDIYVLMPRSPSAVRARNAIMHMPDGQSYDQSMRFTISTMYSSPPQANSVPDHRYTPPMQNPYQQR